MPRRAINFKVLLAVLCALVLSGCITSIAPVRPLPREALASVSQVALAVGDAGIKHYAWSECSSSGKTTTCVLVYSRTATGGVLYSHGFVGPIGTFVQHPDVAVTSSGDAYVVRSVCTDNFNCVDYWSMIPADPDGVEIQTELLHTSAAPSEGPPRIVARGDIVYAVYLVEASGNIRLRYRQLSGGTWAGLVDTTMEPPSRPSLAIDSDGDLHVVWVRNPVDDSFIAYANSGGLDGNFPDAATFDGTNDYLFTDPDIAINNDDQVYLAYAINSGANDTIRVRCMDAPVDCYRGVALLNVPQVDGPWDVWRNVNIEVIGSQPQVVFAATHNSLTHSEVWWYHPAATGGNTTPTRVTNTVDESESEPLIVKENSGSLDVAVVGWRKVNTLLLGTQAVDGAFCFGDVFVFYNSLSTIRKVFDDAGTCSNDGFDMAANGAWVAGVWTDEESDTIQAHAAWTAFNAHLVNLPLVKR